MNSMMNFLKKQPQSYWLTPDEQTGYPPLRHDQTTEVAIIGGGLAGIMTAYYLSLAGAKVILLEANRIGFGTTGHTTAKLSAQHDLIYQNIVEKIGRDEARQYADANQAAISEVKRISAELKIQCDFTPQSAVVYTELEENIEKINREVKTALDLGIKAEFIDHIPFDIQALAGVRFDEQAQFHPRKFLLGIAKWCSKHGVTIHEQSKVIDVEHAGSADITLTLDGGQKVRADAVVIASHYPVLNKPALYFARLYVERSYILAVRAQNQYPGGMYINAEDPARSLRSQPSDEGELILVGGENHKCGQSEDTQEHYRALAGFAGRLFDVSDIPYHWSAQDCMTLDDLPYTGRYSSDTPNLYVTTGYGKWGMTNSVASAMVLRDLISHGRSEWQDVYHPSRTNIIASIKNAVVENANVAVNLLGGKLSPLPDSVDVNPGEGKVVEIDGHRAGVYRDDAGQLHVVDTTCTHLGCEVNWNTAEKSWDCPCHGSRFDVDGNVIEGPAIRGLNTGKSTNTIEKLVKDEF